ncbi:MAG TPA: CHASE3 domain-containing protein [Candidatus Angelobacter sp.]|jgi:PAS domain S-box-containing protein
MRLIYKRFSVISGFAVLLAVLVINTAVTRRQIAIQDSNQGWVDHTQRVLLELRTVESLVTDAETGQRGFLYTGEERYLEPYNNASVEVDAHMDKLAALVVDNPQQSARIPALRVLSKKKLGEIAHTIELYRAGKKDETRAFVLSDVGRIDMEKFRALAADMGRDESALEAKRLQDVNSSTRTLVRTLYLATSLAVIGLMFLALYIVREMDQRERHAAEIREREEWFRVTLGSIGDAVIATDKKGIVTYVNQVAEDLTGIKLAEAKGKAIHQVFPIFNEHTRRPVDNPVAKVLESGLIMGLANHTVLQRRDGTLVPIEDSAAPIYDDGNQLRGVVMVFRDVTLEKQSQSVMRKAEKLAAAGRLAATMAHEINNPLEAVGNLIYIVRHTANLPDEVMGYLAMAEQELERVSHITRQTLGFYRDSSEPGPVEMPAVIESVLKIYDNKIRGKGVALEMQLAPECPAIFGLQGEMKQLIANLISNAADAIGQGGKIRIVMSPASRAQSTGVELKVEDNGPGIATEHRSHIFEPFFTTKKDVGTGLGLWVSKEIAERHGGNIELSSGNGGSLGGAVFTVFLPCDSQMASANGAA